MDKNLKQRLVGLAVVVALAVIFLPMILDGSGVRKHTLEVVIPPQPVLRSNPDFEQKIVELHAKVEELPRVPVVFVDENSSDSTNPGDLQEASVIPEIDTKEDSKKVAQQLASSQAKPEKTGGDSWVLQVGSFKDKAKALNQRDQLRKSNIAAVFIEQYKSSGNLTYRVRLGPFVSRERTKVAQNKLKAKYNIDGLMMKYER